MVERRSSPAWATQLPCPSIGNGSASPRQSSASMVAVRFGSSAAIEKWKIMLTAPYACSTGLDGYTNRHAARQPDRDQKPRRPGSGCFLVDRDRSGPDRRLRRRDGGSAIHP